jgi:hypothetical protein
MRWSRVCVERGRVLRILEGVGARWLGSIRRDRVH